MVVIILMLSKIMKIVYDSYVTFADCQKFLACLAFFKNHIDDLPFKDVEFQKIENCTFPFKALLQKYWSKDLSDKSDYNAHLIVFEPELFSVFMRCSREISWDRGDVLVDVVDCLNQLLSATLLDDINLD